MYLFLRTSVSFLYLCVFFCIPVFAEEIMTEPYQGSGTEVQKVQVVSMTSGYDAEFLDALNWMHTFGLTRFPLAQDFRPYDFISRQEAAKFFSQFAKEILYRTIDQTKYCFFDDLESADPSLKNYILESCLFSMFGGSGGKFFPHNQFTKGQALAVLIRGLDGYKEETGTYRRGQYWQKAREAGLTKDPNISHGDKPVTRYEVALLLYRAAQKIQK